MKISKLLAELQSALKEHGDIEVLLQNSPGPEERIVGDELLYVVPEEYNEGWVVNIRTWPY